MSQENVRAVQTIFEALERGDFDTAFKVIDPQLVNHQAESLPYGGTYRGHNGFRQLFTAISNTWDNAQFPVDEFLDAGDHVVVLSRLKAQAKSSGKEIEVPLAEVFTLRDGKILEVRAFYWDTAKVLRTLE